MVISAYYAFKLKNDNLLPNIYSIERQSKVGNNRVFNLLFEHFEQVQIAKLQPKGILNDYVAYAVKNLQRQCVPEPLIFEMHNDSKNIGIVKTRDKENAVLFHVNEQGLFKVYVFDSDYSLGSLLLQMFLDGELASLIKVIETNVYSGNAEGSCDSCTTPLITT